MFQNFSLYKGMTASFKDKTVTVMGHDSTGTSRTFALRVANSQVAEVLRDQIEKEARAAYGE